MRDRMLFWTEAMAAGLSGLAFLITLAWPDWIERVLGVSLDRGNGSLEWAIVLALLVATTTLGYLARRKWLRLAVSS